MNTKTKKILIVVIILLVVILAGLLIYYFFFRKPITPAPGPEGNLPQTEEELAKKLEEARKMRPALKIKAISNEPVLVPTISSDKNQVIYYARSNGNIWQSDFDGTNINRFSDAKLENLIKVFWSPNKDMSITVFEDNLGNVTKFLYKLADKSIAPLNKYMNYLAWSPDGGKIVYQYQNGSTTDNTLTISNPDGSSYEIALKTRMKNLLLDWPKGNEIFFQEKPSGIVTSSLYSLNTKTKSFSKVSSEIYGLSIKWSPDGNKILYSRTALNGKNVGLYVSNRGISNPKTTGISTLVEKCAWAQDVRYIYCAIPKNIANANVLPDDFYKGTFLSNDDFYRINLETGETKKLLDDSLMVETYDANDVFVSPNESYFFFVNKVNGLLYSIKLSE